MKLKCEASLVPGMAGARQHIFCFFTMFSVSRLVFPIAVLAVLPARAKTNPSDGSMRKTVRLFRAVSPLVQLRPKHTLPSTAGRLHRGDAVAVSGQPSECVRVVAALEGRAEMETDAKTHRTPKALRAKLTGNAWFRQLPGEVS